MLFFLLTQLLTNTPLQRVVNYFVLCRKKKKKNQQQMLVFGQWKRDGAGSDVQRRLFGFTVMVACLIYYEIWNAVPKLSRELEEDRHVVRSRSGSA